MAETLVRKLAAYAAGLVGTRPFKCFVMIEDDEGSRFWSGDGKLRSEFVQARRLENRDWGMTHVDIGRPPAAAVVAASQQHPQQLQWAETTTMTRRTMMATDDFTDDDAVGSRVTSWNAASNGLLEGYSAPFAHPNSFPRGGAGRRPPRGAARARGNPGRFDPMGRGAGPLAIGPTAQTSAIETTLSRKRTRWDMTAKPLMPSMGAFGSSNDYLDPAADAEAADAAAAAVKALRTQRRKKERQRQYEREQQKKLEALASNDAEAADLAGCQSKGFLKFKRNKDHNLDRLMNLTDNESTNNLAENKPGGACQAIKNAAAGNEAATTSKIARFSNSAGPPKSAVTSNDAAISKSTDASNGAACRNDRPVAPLLNTDVPVMSAGNTDRRLSASNSHRDNLGSNERSDRVGSSSAHSGHDNYPWHGNDGFDSFSDQTPAPPPVKSGNQPRSTPGPMGGNTATVRRKLKRQRAEEKRQAEILRQFSSDGKATFRPDLMELGGLLIGSEEEAP